jgi:hypothetical protein
MRFYILWKCCFVSWRRMSRCFYLFWSRFSSLRKFFYLSFFRGCFGFSWLIKRWKILNPCLLLFRCRVGLVGRHGLRMRLFTWLGWLFLFAGRRGFCFAIRMWVLYWIFRVGQVCISWFHTWWRHCGLWFWSILWFCLMIDRNSHRTSIESFLSIGITSYGGLFWFLRTFSFRFAVGIQQQGRVLMVSWRVLSILCLLLQFRLFMSRDWTFWTCFLRTFTFLYLGCTLADSAGIVVGWSR